MKKKGLTLTLTLPTRQKKARRRLTVSMHLRPGPRKKYLSSHPLTPPLTRPLTHSPEEHKQVAIKICLLRHTGSLLVVDGAVTIPPSHSLTH